MLLLPKGNPLFENMAVSKLKLPDIIAKLSNGSFTGYASFVFQASTAVLIFEAGRLFSALVEDENGMRESGFQALSSLAESMVAAGSGALNVYQLSKDLTMCVHALLEGEPLCKDRDLTLIDINAINEKIKNDKMNGCLRIFTDEHTAIVFYKEGNPLGFFHDGDREIEPSPTETQKIAGVPGAKIDLFSTKNTSESAEANLLEFINVQEIWDSCVALHKVVNNNKDVEHQELDRKIVFQQLAELEEMVKSIVVDSVGRVGRGIVDKEISDNGGNSCLVDADRAEKFIKGIERTAKLLVSGTNSKVMMGKLSSALTAVDSES